MTLTEHRLRTGILLPLGANEVRYDGHTIYLGKDIARRLQLCLVTVIGIEGLPVANHVMQSLNALCAQLDEFLGAEQEESDSNAL